MITCGCAAGGRGERGAGHLAACGLEFDGQVPQVRAERPVDELSRLRLVLRGRALDHSHRRRRHSHHHRLLRLLRRLEGDPLPAVDRAPPSSRPHSPPSFPPPLSTL